MASTLTAARLRERLDYNPSTGVFTWRTKPNRRIVVGTEAGRLGTHGYVVIRLDGSNYHAHRLVWLHVHGHWPMFEIDHLNGNRAANALANLRDVDHATNLQNRKAADRDSRSGVLGAVPVRGRFLAQRRINGEYRYLGLHGTAAEANAAYLAALPPQGPA